MSEPGRRREAVVIGGGPAGAMAALCLARAGRDVVLLEREKSAHHKVCGEFLSREAVEYLGQASVDAIALGAVSIDKVRLDIGGQGARAELPFTALSLSRRVMDEALLQRAEAAGCEVRRGIAVERIAAEGTGWKALLRSGETLNARSAFLACGKHDLTGMPRGAGKQRDLVGFKMHWRLRAMQTEMLRGMMQLYLFSEGYGGISLVEGDMANLCLVVRRERLQRLGGWEKLLPEIQKENARLRELLEGAEALWQKPLAIAPIPYGYLGREDAVEGLWCIGDQAAVIPSFTGDGMSIALHSGALAAQMYVGGADTRAYHAELKRQLGRGMRVATAVSQLLVTRPGQLLAMAGLMLVPQVMRGIAAATRIPESALGSLRFHSGSSEPAR